MPNEAPQQELVQPWREWYADLMTSKKELEQITISDGDAGMVPAKHGMSQHGTIALDPRDDVDLFKPKSKPVR
ncbi:hypothetical protein CRV24_000857 [Beauveria bassiana]|nr:hypothetical protein CRV24_000857 [Beauveria bassiana]